MRGAAGVLLRPYRAGDLAACLTIFDGNVPKFFTPDEREEFAGFLKSAEHSVPPYFVLVQVNEVLACGGLSVRDASAALSWGMVARAHQGRGLGKRLTEARIAMARAMPGLTEIVLETSQHSAGFYLGLGFVGVRVTPNGFGPGLDRWDMRLTMNEG